MAMDTADRTHSTRGIYVALRHEIVTLRLKPGERLSENELAARFGTSRAPAREALIRLMEEGLIEVRPQRGSFVTRISLAAMARARFVREALEVSVVRQLASAGTSKAFAAEARMAIKVQRAASEHAEDFTRADDAFHKALADASGVPQIWAVIEREKAQFDRIRFLSLPRVTPVATLIKQHEAILDAILRKDVAGADAAMRAHMSEVLKIARQLAAINPDLIIDDLTDTSSTS
jgi:GntR family transcriptional regulator, rspAB operon transcriptional repressor